MKICVINNLYEPFARGGTERVIENIIFGLKEKKHEVFIITTKPYSKNKPKNKDLDIYYINSCYFNLNKIPKILRLFWHFLNLFNLSSYFKIRHILKKEKPDLVMTHNLEGVGFLTPFAIKKQKIKHIHTLHDMQLLHPSGLMMHGKEKLFDNWHSKIYQKINKYLFGLVDAVISPSNWLLKEHKNRKFFRKSKKIIAPNPVKLCIDKIKKKNTFSETNILYVGQIGKYKGIDLLVEVINNCANKNNINLAIVGTGNEEEDLRKKIKDNKSINFLGQKTKKEVEKLMLSADFLVVPSICYENSPTVIYEAAIVGLPVIASRIGGITELVHSLGGILFNPEDKNDLGNKIIWAIKNPFNLEKIGDRSKKNIKNFRLDNYINLVLRD